MLGLRVPALAERATDVPALARYFCARACEKHRLPRLELSRAGLGAVRGCDGA